MSNFKNLLLLCLFMAVFCELLHAHVYEEDYKFPTQGNHYWTDHDVRNFCWVNMAGDMNLYTDDIYNCHVPLIIDLMSRKYANAEVYDYGFYTDLTNVSEKTFKDYCEWWGYGLGSYWEYRALHTRLINCELGTYLKVQHIMPSYAPRIFSDLKSLVGAKVEFAGAIADVGIRTVRDGMFYSCGNLKFVTFSPPSSKNSELFYADTRSPIYEANIFYGCTSLEVVRFEHEAPILGDSRYGLFTKMFLSNFNSTIENSPNMKAFVVPEYDIENWTEVLKKTHKGVLEGWVKVIPDTYFTTPKPQGVTLNSTAVHLLSVPSTYQLTATVAPSDVYNKSVIWSSSEPAVATVSSTGLVTAKSLGVATIKATLAMDTNFWAASTVVVRPDYVHLKTLSVAGYPFPGGFNANTVSYSLTVPFSTSSINISAEANNYPGVTVTGAGTKTLPVGDNSFPITVNSSLFEHVNKTYTISIHRKSNDAAFKSLTAGGAALPLDRFVHNITVSNATGTFNISAAANHSLASVSGTGNKTLSIGDNSFTVTVTAEEGNKLTHTINVHRKSIDATFKSFTLTGNSGDIPFGFNPATLNYTVPVSNSVTGATVAAVANDPLATVTGEESKALNVGDNTFTVTITPEEGLPKTYTINVHRKSIDDTFKSFTLTGNSGDIPFGFNPATFTYAVTVSYSVTDVTVAAVANYPLATVTGTESKTLNAGDNTFTVTITPEEGQPKTYTINVHRKSGDATLQSVMLGDLIAFDIDSLRDYYTIPVGENIRQVTMQVTPKSSFATVTGDHSQPLRLNIGDNIFKVAVTAEDKIYQKTYTFNIQRNDVYLRGVTLKASVWEGARLVVNSMPLSFDPSKLDYNMDVSYLTARVEIIADAEFPEYVTGTGAFPLEYGENVFNIHLNNNYDREKTYTLKINSTSKNPHNQLQSLNCRPYSISPAYSLDIYNYTLNVEKTVDSISINAVPISPAADLSGQIGMQKLNYGRNLFTFTVTAEDGKTSSTYTLEVWREPLDTDAALSYFAVSPGYLSPSFNPEITSYTAEVGSSVEEVIIDALLRSPTAKFTPGYAKPGKYPVKTGKNWFSFNVSAENSLVNNSYVLTVTRKDNTTNTARLTRNIPTVSIRNGTIEINTPVAERINIYAVTGTLLYSFDKPAGAFTSPFTVHPSLVLIVKGSSGWIKKLVVSG